MVVYLLLLMNQVLHLLLFPFISILLLLMLPFKLFLWSSLVIAAAAAAADDDDNSNEYDLQQHPIPHFLLNSIVKFVVSTSSIHVSKSPFLYSS